MSISRYRYETRIDRAQRNVRRSLMTHIGVGLFLCLTIIGAPIGLIVIIVGIVQHRRSTEAITHAQRDALQHAQRRADEARLRALRKF